MRIAPEADDEKVITTTTEGSSRVRPIVLNHYVGEVVGIPAACLSDPRWTCDLAEDLANRCDLTVVERHLRAFSPGVTCLLILAQSHLALHTWPEYGYLHFDLVACSPLRSVGAVLADALAATSCPSVIQSVRRVEYWDGWREAEAE